MHNWINNLNLTTTPIIGNIIIQNMKAAMLCRAMHRCFFNGVTPQHPTYYFFILVLLSFYTMKYEPYGALNLNQKNVKCLGLQIVSQMQLQFLSSFIITKLVSPTKIALTCLQILVVQKSIAIKYIDSKPLHMHTKI
jgi:hypothetical protein